MAQRNLESRQEKRRRLRIGNGTEPIYSKNRVMLPPCMFIPQHDEKHEQNSLLKLLDQIFPNLSEFSKDPMSMIDSVVLTPKNDCVNEINTLLINRFPGSMENNTMREYTSIDTTIYPNDQAQYEDYLNSLSPNGLPPHKLILKKNCPIMLLRNIDPSQGQCNSTRLIGQDFQNHVILAQIVVSNRKGEWCSCVGYHCSHLIMKSIRLSL